MLEYGFYNSMNGDRRYNSVQMSEIFEGLITDGVYPSVGNMFAVTPGEGLQVIIGTGRAWFNATWSRNKSAYPMSLEQPDPVLSRIDSVCIKVDKTVGVRANSFVVLKGTPANTPVAPTLPVADDVYYHPIANVTVGPNASTITAANIKILVGTSACPFTTSILQQTDIDVLFANWEQQFMDWWDTIKAALDEDVALNLLNRMDAIEKYAGPDSTTYVKIADKATAADVTAGTNDAKWVTPKGIKNGLTLTGMAQLYDVIGGLSTPSNCVPFDGRMHSTDTFSNLLNIPSLDQHYRLERKKRFEKTSTNVFGALSLGKSFIEISTSGQVLTSRRYSELYSTVGTATLTISGWTAGSWTISDIVTISNSVGYIILAYYPTSTSANSALKIISINNEGSMRLITTITLTNKIHVNKYLSATHMKGNGNNIVCIYQVTWETYGVVVLNQNGGFISQTSVTLSRPSAWIMDGLYRSVHLMDKAGFFTRINNNYYTVTYGGGNYTVYKWDGASNSLVVYMTISKNVSPCDEHFNFIGYYYNNVEYIAIAAESYDASYGARLLLNLTSKTLVKSEQESHTDDYKQFSYMMFGHYPVKGSWFSETADRAYLIYKIDSANGRAYGVMFTSTFTTDFFYTIDEMHIGDTSFKMGLYPKENDTPVLSASKRYIFFKVAGGKPFDYLIDGVSIGSKTGSLGDSIGVIDRKLEIIYLANFKHLSYMEDAFIIDDGYVQFATMFYSNNGTSKDLGLNYRQAVYLDKCPPLNLRIR